jgi:predicted dienelactone hydrolase
MFSHGFKGTAVQSVTFTEYLASHGYVVAAMDHQGNTLTDFFADDETVANVAIERPRDVRFAFEQVVAQSASPSGVLTGMVDPSRVAVTGHSFGGYTALMVSGGEVDVSAAQAACAAGAPSDIFCPYVGYWPAGEIVKLDPGIPGLKAEVCLTPGGYSAYGDDGLTKVKVPSMIFGGTLDETTPVSVEIDPIFNALPPTKAEVIIENASHMSYTNVCDLPLAQQWLADFCNVDGMLGPEETFAIANPLAVAFLNWQVKGDASYESYVSQTYADMKLGPAQVKVEK